MPQTAREKTGKPTAPVSDYSRAIGERRTVIVSSSKGTDNQGGGGERVADDNCCRAVSIAYRASYGGEIPVPIIACHQVSPRGISALPVRYVAMLQLISSPANPSAFCHQLEGGLILQKSL
jgi:hypothetical protein